MPGVAIGISDRFASSTGGVIGKRRIGDDQEVRLAPLRRDLRAAREHLIRGGRTPRRSLYCHCSGAGSRGHFQSVPRAGRQSRSDNLSRRLQWHPRPPSFNGKDKWFSPARSGFDSQRGNPSSPSGCPSLTNRRTAASRPATIGTPRIHDSAHPASRLLHNAWSNAGVAGGSRRIRSVTDERP
jgi:hypothetical protein